jgi:hypothetical protein
LKERKNGVLAHESARISPKFFKSHQQHMHANSDGQNETSSNPVNNRNYHSITSAHSVSKKQQQDNAQTIETNSNGINTGIKEEPSLNCVKKLSSNNCNSKKKFAFYHAKSQNNVIVEIVSDAWSAPQVQLDVLDKCLLHDGENDTDKILTRDDRLNMKKIHMRHVLNQYEGMHKYQRSSSDRSKVQLRRAYKLYKKMDYLKEEMLVKFFLSINIFNF